LPSPLSTCLLALPQKPTPKRDIGPEAKVAVPALIEALKDHDPAVRRNAAWALGDIGPEAKAAIPTLIELLKDHDQRVHRDAAAALGMIGPEAKVAIPALIELLKDHDQEIYRAAAEALGNIAVTLQKARAKGMTDQLKDVRDALMAHSDPEIKFHVDSVDVTIEFLERVWWRDLWEGLFQKLSVWYFWYTGQNAADSASVSPVPYETHKERGIWESTGS